MSLSLPWPQESLEHLRGEGANAENCAIGMPDV